MYIVNPKKEVLDKCYRCNKMIGEYLEKKIFISAIHKNDNDYYFTRTRKLENALRNLPLGLLIFEKIAGISR